jgi:signal transduction histidine kinase
MTMRSLRLRLLTGGGIAILISLVVAWFAMTLLFARHVERREIEELDRHALLLIAGLRLDPGGAALADTPPPDERFQRPASGLYWQVSTRAGRLRSRSLWDQDLPSAKPTAGYAWSHRNASGPFEQKVLLLERRLSLAGDREVTIQFAQDEAPVSAARNEFGFELLLFLAGLWVVLAIAGAVQVQLGLQPLRKLRDALDALRDNPLARLSVRDHPSEVAPLIRAINQLAQAREQDLARARRRSADLAHGLKTPLAVLAAQSRHVRLVGGGEAADGLDRAIAAAGAALEAELARARAAAARQGVEALTAPVQQVAERVISVVERTEEGARLVFEIDIPDALALPGSAEELSEVLGALTENAARFARRQVWITATEDAEAMWLCVADDGPGLEDWQAAEALVRGQRLDESGPGHGLGLSIARDLVEARGGVIALKRATQGGLLVEMTWAKTPLASPHPPKIRGWFRRP